MRHHRRSKASDAPRSAALGDSLYGRRTEAHPAGALAENAEHQSAATSTFVALPLRYPTISCGSGSSLGADVRTSFPTEIGAANQSFSFRMLIHPFTLRGRVSVS